MHYTNYGRNHYQSNMNVIYGVIGLNCGIFGYAWLLKEQAKDGFANGYINYTRNFTLSIRNFFADKNYKTLLTSTFAHADIVHLGCNMVSFYYLAKMLAWTPGFTPARLATVIIGSGLSGSLGWLYVQKMNNRNPNHQAVGFSGAVMGVGAVASVLYPGQRMLLYGIVPVPLWALTLGYAFYDGYYLHSENTGIAHAGHMGGLAFGVLYSILRGLKM